MSPGISHLRHALILPVLFALAATAMAADDVPNPKSAKPATPKDIQEAFSLLSSSRFAERDAAMTYLLRQPTSSLSLVEQRLEKESDPEASERLTRAALHLYMKEMTSLKGKACILGIALNLETVTLARRGEDIRAAVAVTELQPGFPAAELLKSGDRLIALNGAPFPQDFTIDEFRMAINQSKPGTKIRFTVLRGKEQLKVDVPLAGLAEEGVPYLQDYMNGRMRKAESYLASLKIRRSESITFPNLPPERRFPASPED